MRLKDRTKATTRSGDLHSRQMSDEKVVSADVVIIGAGIAGLTSAVSAAETGASTVVLEKGSTFHVRGLHNAAINSRLQREAGIEIDRDRVISTIMEFGAYRGDQRLVTLWADNCGPVMDWLLDMATDAHVEVILDSTTKPWYFPNYPLIHVFRPNRQETLARMLQDKAERLGVTFYFETPAVELIRGKEGRVVGAIAQNQGNEKILFEARKAVVLCTGDYGGDSQMVQEYLNWDELKNLKCAYEPPLNTGDGHKMGMAIGAAMDDRPHCPMMFDWSVWAERGLFNLARQPWLYVNIYGERFMNEDLPWGYECNQILRQPEGFAWSVWDSKYNDEWPKMGSQCCKNMGSPTYLWNPAQLTEAIEKGNVLIAQTLEELAEKMGVPTATFSETVARYNTLARHGRDIDFGKHPDRLTTLEQPLFYACKMETRYMVILSGLKVNTKLQVLDINRGVIPGLYAAGNVSGSFFGGNVYSTTTPGLTHSRAWTFGRLAGLNAARLS
ncbi:MAG TPA: FAD-dependent oxidoreductase [Syntrophorhabdaceae bacterium]|nr:FAD-dependent oxidoreductase [Syntrophorhabdaceae bacterium]